MTDEVSKIYLMTKERTVVELTTERYEKEDEFEALLADHPSLMDGEQIDPENPRRWLLVGRQVGISDGAVDVARWDLDLLFVDQEAIPTLVEVKRKSDTSVASGSIRPDPRICRQRTDLLDARLVEEAVCRAVWCWQRSRRSAGWLSAPGALCRDILGGGARQP